MLKDHNQQWNYCSLDKASCPVKDSLKLGLASECWHIIHNL